VRATSSSSFLLSLTLHGFVVVALILTTWITAMRQKELPVIFELVAGPPTNPEALEAPALGNTTSPVKLEVPKVDLVPSMPEPEPVIETQPEPAPTEKTKPKAPERPKADTSLAKQVKKAQKMSYQEYLKKHPTPKQAPATKLTAKSSGKVPRVDAQGIAQGVRGGSTANTKGGGGGRALTREQQDAFNTYISMLIQELKNAHEPPPGVSDRLEAKVTFDITASGAILNPRITKSSGDKEFDRSVIDAFLRMRSIGPTPNRRSDTWTVTFKMRDEA
jgi:colicin import membrane protein